MFRSVDLPASVPGNLYLYRMPGRFDDLDQVFDEIKTAGISQIVSLAPMDEIQSKAPNYAEAIRRTSTPAPVTIVPVEDFDVPSDWEKFTRVARSAAQSLLAGEGILVHCGAGIGRTGMFATLVLHHLGFELQEALEQVDQAGSRPEMDGQTRFLRGLIEGSPSEGHQD